MNYDFIFFRIMFSRLSITQYPISCYLKISGLVSNRNYDMYLLEGEKMGFKVKTH